VHKGEGGADTAPMVFVVDDDGDVRSGLARLLRAHGMQVATFASAREFLRCPRPDGPACLILDVRLAGEDGLRVQGDRILIPCNDVDRRLESDLITGS